MKTKNPGVSLLIAFATSFLVLTLAFSTLDSIVKSLDQATGIQRSTQLFFGSETGLEAAFFHHNARGAGLSLAGNSIVLNDVSATLSWGLEGRTTFTDGLDFPAITGILKENQNIRIPLFWDNSLTLSADPSAQPAGKITNISEDLNLRFYNAIHDIPEGSGNSAKTDLLTKYDDFNIPDTPPFDFGDDGDDDSSDGDHGANGSEVLIDWSFARKNSVTGIQTFIPTDNSDCANTFPGLICENQMNIDGAILEIDTGNGSIVGRVLPDNITTDLAAFWDCNGALDTSVGAGTCSEYQLTFRPLLPFKQTGTEAKIPGIPFMLSLNNGGSGSTNFPINIYTIDTDVDPAEKYSQQILLDINERTSVGAFDYVIFE